MHLKLDSKHKVEPLTSQNWDKFEELFGRLQGANGGCWCMWWRLPRPEWQALTKEERRTRFKQIVRRKEHVGVLLFKDDIAVGWCAVTPPGSLPTFERSHVSKSIDEIKAWRVSCFFVKAGYRNQGYMRYLLQGAIWFAKTNKAPALDAFPQVMKGRAGYVDTFIGVDSSFRACGFKMIEPRGKFRCAMRIEL